MARKESKLESFKITLELSAHMFYTVFTMLFELVFNIFNSILTGVMRHSDKLKSVIPDQTLDWFKKVNKEAEEREASFKAAKDIVEDSFKNIKANNNIQDTVKENAPEPEVKVEDVKIQAETRSISKKSNGEPGVSYIDTIINITIGDVTINNIENMNSLINALKEATAKVKRLDAEQMTLEEVNEVKEKVNQYISQIDSRKSNEEDKK